MGGAGTLPIAVPRAGQDSPGAVTALHRADAVVEPGAGDAAVYRLDVLKPITLAISDN